MGPNGPQEKDQNPPCRPDLFATHPIRSPMIASLAYHSAYHLEKYFCMAYHLVALTYLSAFLLYEGRANILKLDLS